MTPKMSHPDYAAIVTSLLATELGVYEGRMMSSPALKFGDKVFAFYSAKFGMGFRLGRDFDFSSLQRMSGRYCHPLIPSRPCAIGW